LNLIHPIRYLNQEKYTELMDLLYDGSKLLLEHNQVRTF